MGVFTPLSTFFVTPPSKIKCDRVMEVPGIEPGSSGLLHCHLFIVIANLACRIIGFDLSLAMASQLRVVDFGIIGLTYIML